MLLGTFPRVRRSASAILLPLALAALSCAPDSYNAGDPTTDAFRVSQALRCLVEPVACGDVCRMTPQQIVEPANWPLVRAYMEGVVAQGSHSAPTASTIATTFTTDDHYSGTLLARDGNFYSLPKLINHLQRLNPLTEVVNGFNIATLSGLAHVEGVYATNGKIYITPFDRNFVSIVDPELETETLVGTPITGNSKSFGSVQAPNGKIYGIPSDRNVVLVTDPATNTVTSFPSPQTGVSRWATGVLAPNGKIYGIPRNSNQVLVIDPTTDTATMFPSVISGTDYYFSGALAPNGKIYALPRMGPSILVIDPATHSTYTLAFSAATSGPNLWQGAVLGTDGRIYGIPTDANEILIINPANDTVSTMAAPATGLSKWRTGGLHDNGSIYATQFNQDALLKIDTGAAGRFCRNLLLSAYLN